MEAATTRRRLVEAAGAAALASKSPHLAGKGASLRGNEILVYLGRSGRGTAIITTDPTYKTTTGIGPCTPVGALTHAYGGVLASESLPGQRQVVAYRVGRLLFTITPANKIGAVALTAVGFPLSRVRDGGQCGQGEEGK